MCYIKAPLALLATTFITAVLAAPHMNVHIQRDSLAFTKLHDAFNQTNLAVQTANADIQAISSTTDQSGASKLIADLSLAVTKIQGMGLFLASFNGTLDDDDGQRLASEDLIPLLVSINDTVNNIIQQETFISTHFDDFDAANAQAAASLMPISFDSLTGSAEEVLTLEATTLLPIIESVASTLESI